MADCMPGTHEALVQSLVLQTTIATKNQSWTNGADNSKSKGASTPKMQGLGWESYLVIEIGSLFS